MASLEETMAFIWEKIPKQRDGVTIRYIAGDPLYLYQNGFVDTRRVSVDTWLAAFKPYAQPDGTFVLTKDQFVALKIYRDTGPVVGPFDSSDLREGAWSDEDLKALFRSEIEPASGLSDKMYWQYINALKQKGYIDDRNQLMVGTQFKDGINTLVERFPSPRNRLDKEVQRIRAEKQAKLAGNKSNIAESGFSVGESQSENTLASLKKLQSSGADTDHDAGSGLNDENAVDLKFLKKPTAKFFG